MGCLGRIAASNSSFCQRTLAIPCFNDLMCARQDPMNRPGNIIKRFNSRSGSGKGVSKEANLELMSVQLIVDDNTLSR